MFPISMESRQSQSATWRRTISVSYDVWYIQIVPYNGQSKIPTDIIIFWCLEFVALKQNYAYLKPFYKQTYSSKDLILAYEMNTII